MGGRYEPSTALKRRTTSVVLEPYPAAELEAILIQKGVEEAKRSMFEVPIMGTTIPHKIIGEDGAGVVLLKPAAPGTGVIAGGPVRAVVEAVGIKDILSKSLGSDNPINIVHAAVDGLRRLKRPAEIAGLRDREVHQIAPRPMLEAMADAEVNMAAKRAESSAVEETDVS